MSEVLLFRQLTPSDCALLESELPTPNDVDYCAKIERQTPGGYGFYGLFTGAKLIGVCQVRRHGPKDPRALKLATCPEIGNLYIVPAKRNRGYAKVILQRIEAVLGAEGYEQAGLAAEQTNTAALKLYAKQGYARAGTIGKKIPNGSVDRDYFVKTL